MARAAAESLAVSKSFTFGVRESYSNRMTRLKSFIGTRLPSQLFIKPDATNFFFSHYAQQRIANMRNFIDTQSKSFNSFPTFAPLLRIGFMLRVS